MSEGRGFWVEIDQEQELVKLIQKMNSLPKMIAAPSILNKALTSVARQVRKQIIKDAKGRYAFSKNGRKTLTDKAKGGPEVLSASGSHSDTAIRSVGPMREIMDFVTSPNTDTGAAAAKVLNSSSMKELETPDGLKAFVTRFASGHVAIVRRTGEKRLPVKKILSPAVPQMLQQEDVRTNAEVLTYEFLQSEIAKQVEKVLSKS